MNRKTRVISCVVCGNPHSTRRPDTRTCSRSCTAAISKALRRATREQQWQQYLGDVRADLDAGLTWPEIARQRGTRLHSIYRRLLRHQEHELIADMLAKVHPSPAEGTRR